MLRILRAARLGRAPTLGMILTLGPGLMSAAEANTLGGRAFSALVNVPILGGATYVADTGALAPEGGWEEAGLPDTEVGAVFAAQTLVASTGGLVPSPGGDVAASSTSLSAVVLFPGSLGEVTASFVRTQAAATLGGVSGRSEIHQLRFGGQSVQVTGVPNQRVVIPFVGTLVINEQSITTGPTSRAITVNALHLNLATGEEVIVSSASSSLSY
jgi:hypothetical protein